MIKGLINKVITILIWITSFILWAILGWWYIAAAIFTLHLVEVFVVGIKTGEMYGISPKYSLLMTLIFGISWWRPLKNSKRNN